MEHDKPQNKERGSQSNPRFKLQLNIGFFMMDSRAKVDKSVGTGTACQGEKKRSEEAP